MEYYFPIIIIGASASELSFSLNAPAELNDSFQRLNEQLEECDARSKKFVEASDCVHKACQEAKDHADIVDHASNKGFFFNDAFNNYVSKINSGESYANVVSGKNKKASSSYPMFADDPHDIIKSIDDGVATNTGKMTAFIEKYQNEPNDTLSKMTVSEGDLDQLRAADDDVLGKLDDDDTRGDIIRAHTEKMIKSDSAVKDLTLKLDTTVVIYCQNSRELEEVQRSAEGFLQKGAADEKKLKEVSAISGY